MEFKYNIVYVVEVMYWLKGFYGLLMVVSGCFSNDMLIVWSNGSWFYYSNGNFMFLFLFYFYGNYFRILF